MNKELGIYVHIPFCKKKCYYCDFVSYANKEEYINRYVKALEKECDTYNLNQYNVTSIFIGGGTPSYIESKYIKEILEKIKSKFKINNNCEITIEINPGTVDVQKLYKDIGINRLSIGLQSVNNTLLKQIGRIHTYEDFLETYNTAKKIGFENINIDLILAIPNQTLEDIKNQMNEILKLNPTHISTYSLIIEEGTPMEKMVQEKKYSLPDENTERKI